MVRNNNYKGLNRYLALGLANASGDLLLCIVWRAGWHGIQARDLYLLKVAAILPMWGGVRWGGEWGGSGGLPSGDASSSFSVRDLQLCPCHLCFFPLYFPGVFSTVVGASSPPYRAEISPLTCRLNQHHVVLQGMTFEQMLFSDYKVNSVAKCDVVIVQTVSF